MAVQQCVSWHLFGVTLKQSSDADFNARTKEQEALKAELEKAGITAGSGSFEQGDPNYRDEIGRAHV